MSELTWTKADLARIDSALRRWIAEEIHPGEFIPRVPLHTELARVAFMEGVNNALASNAGRIASLVLADWAEPDRFVGIAPAEKRACVRLAERLLKDGMPAGFVCPTYYKPDPAPLPAAAPPQAPQPIDRVALARVQAAHGIRADALEGRVSVHGAGSCIGDTDELWGDYPHLVHWRVIATAAGGWKTGEISAHFPAPPGAVDLRGLPSQHGMLRADALAPLVRALRACAVGAHLVTDCHADLLARELPIWVGSV